MAKQGFDISQLQNYEKKLLGLAVDLKKGKYAKSFLRKEGTKLRRKTLSIARRKVKKVTGNYFKSIKRGKVYLYKNNGAWSIRVYSNAPHAHLIEHGHRQVTADGREVGFVQGKHVFEVSEKQFTAEYFADVQNFIDDVLKKGL